MKNIRKISVFGGEIFKIFELAYFCNDFIYMLSANLEVIFSNFQPKTVRMQNCN